MWIFVRYARSLATTSMRSPCAENGHHAMKSAPWTAPFKLQLVTCAIEPEWLVSLASARQALEEVASSLPYGDEFYTCSVEREKIADDCSNDPYCSSHRECWGHTRGGTKVFVHPRNCSLAGTSNKYPRRYVEACGVWRLARERGQLLRAKKKIEAITVCCNATVQPLWTVVKIDAILKVLLRVKEQLGRDKCSACGHTNEHPKIAMKLNHTVFTLEKIQAEYWYAAIMSSIIGAPPTLPPSNPKVGTISPHPLVAVATNSSMAAANADYQQDCEAEIPIQEIEHDEAPAVRDETLLLQQSEEDWASSVEFCLHGCWRSSQKEDQSTEEQIFLLKYNRAPEVFRTALLEGLELKQCRDALQELGFNCVLKSLAEIFVHPWQYEEVVSTLRNEKVELKNVNVIVSASLEHLVQAALEKIPSRQGVRLKNRSHMSSAGSTSTQYGGRADAVETWLHEVGEDEVLECISRVPLRIGLKKRRPKSVTQSTTEAHAGQPGLNPRRFRILDDAP